MPEYENASGASDEWYTPPHVFEAMGVTFDIDVASPGGDVTPWIPARAFKTTDSLNRLWQGFVWMNPPFGGRNGIVPWLEKFFAHGNGVALTPDRTSAPWWNRFARRADGILFFGKPDAKRGDPNKIGFIRPDGSIGRQPGMGTTLMAAGPRGLAALQNAADAGFGLLLVQSSRPHSADDRASCGATPGNSGIPQNV